MNGSPRLSLCMAVVPSGSPEEILQSSLKMLSLSSLISWSVYRVCGTGKYQSLSYRGFKIRRVEELIENGKWNSIHAAVKEQMNSGGLKGALLTKAVNTKLAKWRETGEVTHPIYDALVFRKVSEGKKIARTAPLSESRVVW